MELKGLKKWIDGKYTHLYHLNYETNSGNTKIYEMISRNDNIIDGDDVRGRGINAVIILAFNKDHTKILMNKEFRMAVNSYVYNLPAGLIESGESIEEAGKRELFEETGLIVTNILDVLKPSYSSVGLSNEKTVTLVCEAEGTFDKSHLEDCEDIEPMWLSKEDARSILSIDEIPCAARTQMLLYMWVNNY